MKPSKKNLANLRWEQAISLKKHLGDHERILAKDLMIQPIFLYENDDIDTILWKLQMEDVNCCIVVDEHRKFVWELTDEILLKIIARTSVNEPLVKILDVGYKRWINYTHAKDYVHKHKHFVYETTPLFEIMKFIDKKWFQYIPVLDREKSVVWLITPSSVLRFLLNR